MSSLESAAERVRLLKTELAGAEVNYNFHNKMASSAFDEIKQHRRNLEQAEQALVREATRTPGAPVPGPRNTTKITNTKVSN